MELSQFASPFERPAQGQLIGKFQAAAGRKTVSNARDLDPFAGKSLRQIIAGGVAFDIGSERKDDFLNGFAAQALLQIDDAKIFRSHSVQRRNLSTQNMEFAPISPGLLDADDVDRTFDDADQRRVTPGVRANTT